MIVGIPINLGTNDVYMGIFFGGITMRFPQKKTCYSGDGACEVLAKQSAGAGEELQLMVNHSYIHLNHDG